MSASVFDSHAEGYDRVALSAVGQHHRARVRSVVERHLTSRSRVLDLGCGTGLDTSWLLQSGHRVSAIDSSPAMVAKARERIDTLDPTVADNASISLGDIDRLQPDEPTGPFDLVLANFGVVNCCRDLPRLGRTLWQWLAADGTAVLVTMAPLCPPELAQAALTGNRQLATRRRSTHHDGYDGVVVSYHSARSLADRLRSDLAPGQNFELVESRALGSVLATFEQRRHLEDRPRLLAALGRLDRALAAPLGRTPIGDHQIAVLRKRRHR